MLAGAVVGFDPVVWAGVIFFIAGIVWSGLELWLILKGK